MSTIHEGFNRLTKLGHSLDDRAKMVEAHAKVTNKLLKVFEAQELKL